MTDVYTDQTRDVETEEALLGALIMNPAVVDDVDLDGSEFSVHANGMIYKAMRRVEGTLDAITLKAELERQGQLAEVGGLERLVELGARATNSQSAASYAAIIRDKYRRRRALASASKLATAAADPEADYQAETAALYDALLADAGQGGAQPLREVLSDLFDEVSAANESPREFYGIPTGFAGFDKITSGLQRGEVMMLSGEPGVGKSSLAMQLVIGAARGIYGYPGTAGAVYQLEMRAIAVARRAIAYEAKVEAKNLRSGKLAIGDMERFVEATGVYERLPILISDRTDWTTLALRADISRLKAQHNIGWVLIDYMALLKDDPGVDANERSALVSDRVHAIAKDYDVAILAVHDLTKAGMTGQTGGQAALAGSRRVLYNADSIAILSTTNTAGVLQLAWSKFREDAPNRALWLSRADNYAHFAETAQPF